MKRNQTYKFMMTIVYQKEKKRIILWDKDLEKVSEEQVRLLMKKVLGRHYENLQGKGGGWSIPIVHEKIINDWIEEYCQVPEEETPELKDQSTQTDPPDKVEEPFRYKYDIDPALYAFGRQWLMG